MISTSWSKLSKFSLSKNSSNMAALVFFTLSALSYDLWFYHHLVFYFLKEAFFFFLEQEL